MSALATNAVRFDTGVKAHAEGRLSAAETEYLELLKAGHRVADCLANLSMIHFARQDFVEAEKLARAATLEAPQDANAWNNLGLAAKAQGKLAQAKEAFAQALRRDAGHSRAWSNLAMTLEKLGDDSRALAAFERVVQLDPDWIDALVQYIYRKLGAADWAGLDSAISRITAHLKRGGTGVDPFLLLFICNDPVEMQQASRQMSRKITQEAVAAGPKIEPVSGIAFANATKIRVGYVSANFNAHAVAAHVLQLMESHNTNQFEVFAYCHSLPPSPAVQTRLESAGVTFRRISDLSDDKVCAQIRADQIEVLIDLMGYTSGARLGIFVRRPAPVQITWIGFAGTIGADWMDYIVADKIVLPPGDENTYDEKIIRMPHCYQANDATRMIHTPTPIRQDYGLPEHGPLLCCFNKPAKINPGVLAVWAAIMKRVPDSVLWLWDQNALVGANLRTAFREYGIDEGRIFMARSDPIPVHLARHAMCDLFLDTFPYGGHATATNALYGGCPLIAMQGRTFASRVSASLLTSLGMDDMIARTPEEYVEKSVAFLSDPHRIEHTKKRLQTLRTSAPLYDGTVFARDFERALTRAANLSRDGKAPEDVNFDANSMNSV